MGLAKFCMFMPRICIIVDQICTVSNSCNQVYIVSILDFRSIIEIIKHGG